MPRQPVGQGRRPQGDRRRGPRRVAARRPPRGGRSPPRSTSSLTSKSPPGCVSSRLLTPDAQVLIAGALRPLAVEPQEADLVGERRVVGQHARRHRRRRRAAWPDRSWSRRQRPVAPPVRPASARRSSARRPAAGRGAARARSPLAPGSSPAGRTDRPRSPREASARPARRTAAIACSRLAGSRLQVSGSTSTNTGTAPRSTTASALAAKVKAGTKTASPGPIARAISTSSRASVPLAQVTTWRTPQAAASAASKRATSGPKMNWPCASTAAIAASIRPSRRRRWACRSTKGKLGGAAMVETSPGTTGACPIRGRQRAAGKPAGGSDAAHDRTPCERLRSHPATELIFRKSYQSHGQTDTLIHKVPGPPSLI